MTRAELEEMTKEDLVNYADDHDIEVHQHWVKDDIIKEILKGQKAAAKPAPAQSGEPAPAKAGEPATADELADVSGELVKFLENAGHRDHVLVIKAKDIIERFK